MKRTAKLVAVAIVGMMIAVSGLSLTACNNNKAPEGYTTIGYICCGLTNSNRKAFENMVNAYNSTQGNIDKVYVDATYSQNEEYGQYSSELNRGTKYSVATVRDSQIRSLATTTAKNGFVNLDTIATDELKAEINGMPKELVNRFRVNSSVDGDGKYVVGEGAALLGVPIGSQPHVLYYNTAIFKTWKINTVSIAEDKITEYNAANGGTLVAHGYAEYKNNPLPNATPALEKSANEKGEQVYKVFNNRIAMSWAEQRLLARYFQKSCGYDYGFMSEWWFNYLWSIGGDAIVWNDTEKSYEFSLCDTVPNYLATATVDVNGRTYKQGDVLFHEDSVYLSKNASNLEAVKGSLQELPSNYEAFVEFNRLGVPTDKNVDAGYEGYGVAPNTTDKRTGRFLTGNDCPLLVEAYELGVQSFNNTAVKNSWDIAPTSQYRLYENNGVYYTGSKTFANEYLMVIGEKYDLNNDGTIGADEIYTGEVVKTSNGTPVVGEVGAASVGYSLSIPAKAPKGTQEAALKFITWVAGKEGQKFIGQTNTLVPSNLEYALSDELANDSARVCNIYAASLSTGHADVGDYTYFNSRTWIDNWSGELNGEVRRGEMTLNEFLYTGKQIGGTMKGAKLAVANSDLKTMNLHIKGR